MSDPSPAAYAALARELNAARAYQAAVDDILHLVGITPNDAQPVFDAIVAHARTLCDAEFAMAARRVGAHLHLMASIADESTANTEAEARLRTLFPMSINFASPSAQAVRERCTVHIADPVESAGLNTDLRAESQYHGTRSALAVPILRDGSVLGVVTVYRRVPGLFAGAQVKLLETFAAQAAIALDNARLFNETREALEQQTAISDILRFTTESPTDVQPVLDAIADQAVRLCDAASASIFLIEGDGLRHVSTRGALVDQSGAPVDPATAVDLLPIDRTSTSGRAVLECRVVQVDDMQDEAHEYPRGYEYAQRLGHRSVMVAPLCREGLPFGTLLLRRTQVRPFNAREAALLRTFGDQAAIALESTRLFNETQQALERQTALSEVLRVISQSPTDAAPVFDAIAERAARLCKAQMGLSFRFDGALLHLIGVHGVSRDGEEAVRGLFPQRPDPVTFVGRVALAGMPVFSADASIDLEPGFQDSVRRMGARSVLGVPMLRDGKVIGGLGVARTEPGGFAPALVQLLETFAAQAVIAVENVRLFNETRAALEQQTASAEALRVTSASLAAANQHKSEFLANMSHELRTALNAIIGFSEVMLARMFGELNDKQEDYLKDIFSSGKHLLSLINDILDLSKIEAGRMELDLEDFDIALALGNTMTLIRERAQQHGIKLSLVASDELGSLRADQRKLKQIMLNLLSNAVKFTPDGGGVTVRAEVFDNVLRVAVIDTGIGIADADQDTVFQAFRQVGGNYTNKGEGTGLGLALTRRFVELHGGQLHVESALGEGSTFTFTLPALG